MGTRDRRAGSCSAPPPAPARCCCRACSARSTRPTPTCGVSLVVSDTQTVCERVLDDELELGIVGAARAHRGLVFEPFVRDELVAIVPPAHPLAAAGSVTLEELVRRADADAAGGLGRALGASRRRCARAGCATATCTSRWSSACSSRSRPRCSTASGSRSSRGWPWSARWPTATCRPAPRGAGARARDFFAVRHAGRTPKRVTTAFLEFARAELGDMRDP